MSVVRAVAASRPLLANGDRLAPKSWRTSASQPAEWGDAADVPPKKHRPWGASACAGQLPPPKGPTPETDTLSRAVQKSPGSVCRPEPATPVHGPGALPGQTVVSPNVSGP